MTVTPDIFAGETDLALLRRFRDSGDPEAFSEIVRRYAGAVFAACHRVLHNPASAEDATQETFFRLMTRPQRVNASLGGWLHRAATRLALDIRRSDVSRRRREISYQPPPPLEASSWADIAPTLDEALAALTVDQRDLLVRHFLRGEAQAELANEAGTSAATMCRRIKAAVESLREELARRGVNAAPAVLFSLLLHNAASPAPPTLKLAMGKMSLFCTARPGGVVVHPVRISPLSRLTALPRGLFAARWALTAALFSLLVAIAAAVAVSHVQVFSPGFGGASQVSPVDGPLN